MARIVRVNHAGEYGAIRIYRAQISVARRLYPDIAHDLGEMLEHEIRHCAVFSAAMPARVFGRTPEKRAGKKQEVDAPRGAGAERRTLAHGYAVHRNT